MLFSKTAKSDDHDDLGTRFVDDGGPNAYSTHYKNLLGSVTRSFLTAKKDYTPPPEKTASGDNVRFDGIVRRPSRHFHSRDTMAREKEQRKLATVMGGPNSSELEQAFAQIAETYITDKAPLLTNYMLGFQLLKKTEDDTKVCGIFAYKVGDELVYIPVFSLNGDIQGHELMYVVSRDQFVPSDEKWVNYLLSRKPLEPGGVERRDRSQIPTQGNIRPSYVSSGLKLSSVQPNRSLPPLAPAIVLDALRTIFKQASVGTPLLERSFWRDVAESRDQRIPELRWKLASSVDLDVRQLFRESYRAVKLAAAWSRDYPVFARLLNYVADGAGVDEYLRDWEKRAELARSLGVRPVPHQTFREKLAAFAPVVPCPVVKEGTVSVTPLDAIPHHQFRFMTSEQVDRLHRDGYMVSDTRDPQKLASILKDAAGTGLCNPVGPGLYRVFMADGSFRECFVLYEDDPTCRSDNESRWVVLDKETKKTRSARHGDIWTSERDSDPNWLDKLPASNGTIDLKTDCQYERHRDVTSWLITPSGHAWQGRFLENTKNSYYEEGSDTSISLTSTTIKGFRTICSSHGQDGYASNPSPVIASKGTVLRRYKDGTGRHDRVALGSRQLWLAMLMEGTLPVTVQKQQGALAQYAIDGKAPQEKSAALESLMRDHHLSHATAESLIQDADQASPRGIRVLREKIAFSGPMPTDRFSVVFPQKDRGTHDVTGLSIEQDLDTEEPIESLRPTKVPDDREMWPGLLSAETNSSSGPPAPDQTDMNLAAQASQAGQKDFVSSQMLLSLLREIDHDDLIPKYINTFEKACDTLGRLYMQLLWRTDAFEERFGRTQLKEFKEMLVELFQQMGDFICYLRQRDVRPAPVLSMSATNIEEGQ